jgi:hypothetical protein
VTRGSRGVMSSPLERRSACSGEEQFAFGLAMDGLWGRRLLAVTPDSFDEPSGSRAENARSDLPPKENGLCGKQPQRPASLKAYCGAMPPLVGPVPTGPVTWLLP